MKNTGLRKGVFSLWLLSLLLTGFEPSDVVYENCKQTKALKARCEGFSSDGAGRAKNIILVIGDGMGINQVYAGRVFVNGPDRPFKWEKLPAQSLVNTCAIRSITDSAAAATALATGHKTRVGVVSMSPPPGAKPYRTILERLGDKKAAGLVTTSQLWDATPAAFAAHAPSRTQAAKIAAQMVEKTMPEVMLGGGRKVFRGARGGEDLREKAKALGYAVVEDRKSLLALDPESTSKALGLFNEDSLTYEKDREPDCPEPHLSEMTKVALRILERDPRGFFLMVEGGRIDHAGHAMDMDRLVREMAEFNRTVDLILEWMEGRDDTLLIITADHETGGVEVLPGDYKQGDEPEVKWTTSIMGIHANHSSQRVPLFAEGPNAEAVPPRMDNTEIYCIMKNAAGLP